MAELVDHGGALAAAYSGETLGAADDGNVGGRGAVGAPAGGGGLLFWPDADADRY